MTSRHTVAAQLNNPPEKPSRHGVRFWFLRAYLPLLGTVLLCAALLSGCGKAMIKPLPAPAQPLRFSTTDLGGRPVDERVFQNAALTLLVVFSTDCGPCAGEMPAYKSLAAAHTPDEFQVIGIAANMETPPADGSLAGFVEAAGERFLTLLYRPEMAETFLKDVGKVPARVWLDRQGRALAAPETGAKPLEDLEAELERYLNQIIQQENSEPAANTVGAPDSHRKAGRN